MSELTPKQESACQAYVLSQDKDVRGNKSGAYRSAYNASKMKMATVNRAAKTLFDNSKIAARVAELQAEIKSALIADEVELQEFWTGVMRGDIQIAAIDKETGAEIELKPEIKDRLKSSELLGKNKALFVDRKDLSGNLKVDLDWTVKVVK